MLADESLGVGTHLRLGAIVGPQAKFGEQFILLRALDLRLCGAVDRSFKRQLIARRGHNDDLREVGEKQGQQGRFGQPTLVAELAADHVHRVDAFAQTVGAVDVKLALVQSAYLSLHHHLVGVVSAGSEEQ